MMHLGDHVSALVDGQLPPEVTEEANAHLATCPVCLQAVERERAVKAWLTGLSAPEPRDDLVLRLLSIPQGGPVVTTSAVVPAAVASLGVTTGGHGAPVRSVLVGPLRSPTGRPGGTRAPEGRTDPGRPGSGPGWTRRRTTAAVLGTMSLVGAGMVGLRSMPAADTSPMVPPVAQFVTGAPVTNGMPPLDAGVPTWRATQVSGGR
jgi:anti-sigma factor RsiW